MRPKNNALIYSRALILEAQKCGCVAEVAPDLKRFAAVIEAERRVAMFFNSPIISLAEKYKLIDLFAFKNFLARNFIKLLVRKNNIGYLKEAALYYEMRSNKILGLANVYIKSAAELGAKDKLRLEKSIGKMISKKVLPHYILDPALVAGVVIDINHKVYDASLKNNIRLLSKSLIENS